MSKLKVIIFENNQLLLSKFDKTSLKIIRDCTNKNVQHYHFINTEYFICSQIFRSIPGLTHPEILDVAVYI